MLRISGDDSSGDVISLRVEGQAMGRWVAEIRRACEPFLVDGRRLVLDLAGVSFADREAVMLFREFKGRGATFINCSPLLTEQLKEPPV